MANRQTARPDADPDADRPWWRHGMMWLVVGGPAVVVVAGVLTAVIAIRGADTLVEEPSTTRTVPQGADAPAMKARNHAATPKSP